MPISRRNITDDPVEAARIKRKELNLSPKDPLLDIAVRDIHTVIRSLPGHFNVIPKDAILAAAIRNMPDPRNKWALHAYKQGILELFAALPSPNTQNLKQIGSLATQTNAMSEIMKYIERRQALISPGLTSSTPGLKELDKAKTSDISSQASADIGSDKRFVSRKSFSSSSMESSAATSSSAASHGRLREQELAKQQLTKTIQGIEHNFGHRVEHKLLSSALKYMPDKPQAFYTYLQAINNLCASTKQPPTGQNFKSLAKLAQGSHPLEHIKAYIDGRAFGQDAVTAKKKDPRKH